MSKKKKKKADGHRIGNDQRPQNVILLYHAT